MPARFKWSLISDERLLDMRLCDLPIRIKGSFIEPHLKRLYRELNDRGIRFKPHVWLSAEWFTPDGVPGFAIPFYLAHPRLMRLERKLETASDPIDSNLKYALASNVRTRCSGVCCAAEALWFEHLDRQDDDL